MAEVWIWQTIISPHMAGIAVALADRGHAVTYLAEQTITTDRVEQGWQIAELPGVVFRLVDSTAAIEAAVSSAPVDSLHVCQGLRANGLIGHAQHMLRRRGLRQWAVMETINDAGLAGMARAWLYRCLFLRWRNHLQGVLAIGWRTPAWVRRRGMPGSRIFPFAYFLEHQSASLPAATRESGPFQVLFVGQLIARKHLGLLMDALGTLAGEGHDVNLQVVGTGPLEAGLRERGQQALGDRIQWSGGLPMAQARAAMQAADCLVLPSRHDGWGAVVSEALTAGTPAIASDACGSAGVIRASGVGGVFSSGDMDGLVQQLRRLVQAGKPTAEQRAELAAWARCLGVEAGAEYLMQILDHKPDGADVPLAPWAATSNQEHSPCVG